MPKAAKSTSEIDLTEEIADRIYFVRGQKVMLDYDLAILYEVETKRLNEQVKRNIDRFPEDFMFQINAKEWALMRSQFATTSTQNIDREDDETMWSQIATTSPKKRRRDSLPYAFTEHGVTMLASVLKSERAIKMSIAVVRAFIELKKSAFQFKELSKQLEAIKQHLGEHDAQLNGIYTAIENLLDDKINKQTAGLGRKRIGFRPDE